MDDDGLPWVSVVYGTTKLRREERLGDFVVANLAELDAAGLYRATRFDLNKCATLPWATNFFQTRPGYQSPVIGRLSEYGIYMLQVTISVRQARQQREVERQAKIAAEQYQAGEPPSDSLSD
ncbi:hypothetical protein ACFOMD_01710 [Sphingoaurantiacus capsulatus]|uniref:Uncharacterized protein n=1 Tax=Sphingoaurantiacus capsulatus TaxID=1771310 RepID=A0ABV7X5K8_9SPHN